VVGDVADQLGSGAVTVSRRQGGNGSAEAPRAEPLRRDPDINEFELVWMLPREAWGEDEKAAAVDRLDLQSEITRWTGVRTAGQLVAERTAL
jgi:hypothetical protein